MTESQPTGYNENETTDANSSGNLVDGTPGNEAGDRGDRDTLTTDDEAQHDDAVARPGNTPD